MVGFEESSFGLFQIQRVSSANRGSFLASARELRVLWSEPYLTSPLGFLVFVGGFRV